jgi:hypothetical protein
MSSAISLIKLMFVGILRAQPAGDVMVRPQGDVNQAQFLPLVCERFSLFPK